MKRIGIFIFFFLGLTGAALADRWDFLPAEPLFNPLIGDLREPQYTIIAPLNKAAYDGDIGQTFDFIQWQSDESTKWAWGINGASFLELGSKGNAEFPLLVSDWYLGTYFSEKSGNLSNRLEFEHVSSHLGDFYFNSSVERIIYSRESLRIISSYDFSQNFRVYGGPCYWTHLSPDSGDPRLFFQAGAELYSGYYNFFLGLHLRGYATYNIEVLGEAGGVVNQTIEAGLQWRWKKDSHQSLRTAALYYTGNNLYGQFYQNPDSYFGLGIFFDP